jgi:Glycoside hydrolase family 44
MRGFAKTAFRWIFVVVALMAIVGVSYRFGRPLARKVARRLRRRFGHEQPVSSAPATVAAPQAAAPIDPARLTEILYDGELRNGWVDFGWAQKELGPGPAKVKLANFGGWIIAKPGVESRFGMLVFRFKAPPGDLDFLQVHVASPSRNSFPLVNVIAAHTLHLTGADAGWDEVQIPVEMLDPAGVSFDRVILNASRPVSSDWTLIDRIGFTAADPAAQARQLDATTYPPASFAKAAIQVRCAAPARKVSPWIYGIAYDAGNGPQEGLWDVGATIRRWGGNLTSRYNWEVSAWNLAADWFYENMTVPSYATVLDADAKHGIGSALTVPIMGWIAKDGTSNGFSVAEVGPQDQADPWRPAAGNGIRGGKELPAGPPERTSIPLTPESIGRWVETIRAADAKTGHRSVDQYILDNEPSIWNRTHRDVRHEPVGYDELLDRTIQFGTAIRKADPDAVIAGPAEWGWLGYMYSGKDSEHDWAKEDRAAHGDVPFIEWYLRKLREHEQKTGVRVLDVLDVHYYPSADGIYEHGLGNMDPASSELRIRSTRSLWDPDYEDESWVHEKIRLLPRMAEWIANNYPGRGISIGEWNFGGEDLPSGGLATAEALGRFAQFGVTSAFYWTFPPAKSPSALAFVAYRNFDGKGGRFLDYFVPSSVSGDVSLFASRSEDGKHLVLVAVNPSAEHPATAAIDLSACGAPTSQTAFVYVRGGRSLVALPEGKSGPRADAIEQFLPPSSITVIDLPLAAPMAGTLQ